MYSAENFFLFDGLTAAEKTDILNALPEPCFFSKDEVIFDQNTYKKAIGLVLDGKAVSYSGRVTQRTFKAGDVFGAAAVFGSQGGYVSRIVAKTASSILFIDEQALRKMFSRHPKTAVNYITFLSDRVRFLNKKISHLGCQTARDKLYSFLLSNAVGSEYTVPNMQQLARLTGIGRTSLYRAFSELENEGKITKQENKVKVNVK